MSKAPSVITEYSFALTSRSNNSLLMRIGPSAALALTKDTSLVGLYVLMDSSMWRISSSTASIAASAFARSSDHNSTVMRVPMMPSVTRLTHSACAGAAAARVTAAAKHSALIMTLNFMRQSLMRFTGGGPPPLRDDESAADHAAQMGEMCNAGQRSGNAQKQLDAGVNGGEEPCRHGNRRNQGNDLAGRKHHRIREQQTKYAPRCAEGGTRRRTEQSRYQQVSDGGGDHRGEVAHEQEPRTDIALNFRAEHP